MFPKDAHFICRKCLVSFRFLAEDLAAISKNALGGIACPCCKSVYKRKRDIERFFKFYPRLFTATGDLKDCGMEFIDYSFHSDDDVTGLFWFKNLEFKCHACGNHSIFSLSQVDKFADTPGLFACKKCRIHPKPLKTVKEFFVSFRWVQRSTLYLGHLLWDIISPLKLDPQRYPIQLQRTRGANPE